MLRPEELELYRIDEDPYEVDNLAKTPENRELVRNLFAQLKTVMTQAGESTAPDLTTTMYGKGNQAEKKSPSAKRRSRHKKTFP